MLVIIVQFFNVNRDNNLGKKKYNQMCCLIGTNSCLYFTYLALHATVPVISKTFLAFVSASEYFFSHHNFKTGN